MPMDAVLPNAVVFIAAFFGGAAFVWGVAGAAMVEPPDHRSFDTRPQCGRSWRVA